MLPWINSKGSPEPCTSYSRSAPLRLTRCIGVLLFLSEQLPTHTFTFLRDTSQQLQRAFPCFRVPARRMAVSQKASRQLLPPRLGADHSIIRIAPRRCLWKI